MRRLLASSGSSPITSSLLTCLNKPLPRLIFSTACWMEAAECELLARDSGVLCTGKKKKGSDSVKGKVVF